MHTYPPSCASLAVQRTSGFRSTAISTFAAALLAIVASGCANQPTATSGTSLTEQEATSLIEPLYGALAATSPADVTRLLQSVTSPRWVNCSSNDFCEDRSAVLTRWTRRIDAIPDFKWVLKEMIVSGNHIVVRGEDTGTPSGTFLGIPHDGRSFRIMTIDIHTVEQGRLVRSVHLEDWATAMRQIR